MEVSLEPNETTAVFVAILTLALISATEVWHFWLRKIDRSDEASDDGSIFLRLFRFFKRSSKVLILLVVVDLVAPDVAPLFLTSSTCDSFHRTKRVSGPGRCFLNSSIAPGPTSLLDASRRYHRRITAGGQVTPAPGCVAIDSDDVLSTSLHDDTSAWFPREIGRDQPQVEMRVVGGRDTALQQTVPNREEGKLPKELAHLVKHDDIPESVANSNISEARVFVRKFDDINGIVFGPAFAAYEFSETFGETCHLIVFAEYPFEKIDLGPHSDISFPVTSRALAGTLCSATTPLSMPMYNMALTMVSLHAVGARDVSFDMIYNVHAVGAVLTAGDDASIEYDAYKACTRIGIPALSTIIVVELLLFAIAIYVGVGYRRLAQAEKQRLDVVKIGTTWPAGKENKSLSDHQSRLTLRGLPF
mmetsp:Transcript_18507/g.45553  ORF Transcript_18507/g.45553 Transcript_18507/m.45553 type:complete len:417 (+) Transcript_18507:56-1306(+)|eukprot:CAMPEP_0198332602 /NCGR_PEP_ID=MMETSP1450-20131203/18392_1 /TAXON_ID=753684 ORGANISM="Madagascaria erythrocladiodes, Strain CCMP3234" /NCGR_SAMPLE_ID=MMETSP1450 /ASSEMBLY_ACC=CAM_ASM_001115 /LENGTH=416 /DNA_ID=CAMNT_0044037063 /DNA_START=62 /DNA_END=1312 /DNA_ORIENTATION=-